jgi:pimeloyl-ACP methyl ester carboxylesterase
VLVHGLTFDRRIWQPIIDRLGDSVTSLAIDLPVHGESRGEPVPMQDVADQVHSLVQALGLERPIVVGHSVGHSIVAAAAGLYAATYPTRHRIPNRPGAWCGTPITSTSRSCSGTGTRH